MIDYKKEAELIHEVGQRIIMECRPKEFTYDKEYWKQSFYTWSQKTVDEINAQLRNQKGLNEDK